MKSIYIFIFPLILLVCALPTDSLRNQDDIDYLLEKSGIQKSIFNLKESGNGNYHTTNLDVKRDLWLFLRKILLKKANKNISSLNLFSWIQGKLQKPKSSEEFPCALNGTRSPVEPANVHQLRPGDIDVIAAIGDSVTAGNGAMAITSIGTYTEFRGLSFSGGGMNDWRTMLTLPNILKVFNPNLYGFATANVVAVDKESHLNVAEPMMLSRDLVYQVQVLIQRMKQDPLIDMQKHWKLLTIFVGSNDFCTDMCHYDNIWDFLKRHEEDLHRALTILRDNVPRLVVNLLPPPNVINLLRNSKNIPLYCQLSYTFTCSCLMKTSYSQQYLQKASEFITRWQAIDEHVASLAEFQTNDFAIAYQPFMANFTVPEKENGNADMRFFAKDCFHFSQLGHASAANTLWNNMLQAPGQKDLNFIPPFQRFVCPTLDNPYIATLRNSGKY